MRVYKITSGYYGWYYKEFVGTISNLRDDKFWHWRISLLGNRKSLKLKDAKESIKSYIDSL